MKISKDARKLARDAFHWTLVDGKIDQDRVRQIADSIATNKPRHFVEVLKEFTRLVRLKFEESHATIESAVSLDTETANQLTASIQKSFGRDITTDIQVNPELIAGLRIQIGSDVWDGSVRARLDRLKEKH